MIATAESWKREPFGEVVAVPYRASFDAADLERLRAGLVPRAMEDKWFVYHADGSLFLHRSWTGEAVFRVDLAEDRAGGARVAAASCAREVLDGAEGGPEYQARLLGFLVGALLLGRREPFPLPTGEAGDGPSLFQHVAAGTGHAEAGPPARPWWRRWIGR